MLKITINNEEVVSNKDFTIEEEMLNTSSVILNNVYPKSWENDKDYVSRFYHPNDYSKCLIKDEDYTPAEPGLNEEGTNFEIQVDTTKLNELTSMKGNTSQSGTPTPTAPVPINVVSGRQDVVVAQENALDIQRIVKGRLDNGNIGYESNVTNLDLGEESFSFTTNANYRGVTTDFIHLRTSTFIYFGYESTTTNIGATVSYYDENMKFISQSGGYGMTNAVRYGNSVANAKYIRIYFALNTAGSVTITKPQIRFSNENSIPTYEAYKGNTYEINLGKNLFDIGTDLTSYFQTSNNGITINNTVVNRTTATINESTLTINSYDNTGYTWISKWLTLDKNTDYIISGTNNNDIKIVGFSSNALSTVGTLITTKTSSNATKTFNSGNYNYYCLSFYPGATGKYFEDIQVEKGSQATSYSPFRNYTKNLFDSNLKQGGRYFSNGNFFTASNYVHNENPISVVAGETYTLSATNYSARSEAGFVFFNNGTFVSSSKQSSQTFTVPSGANQVYCDFYTGSNIAPSDITNIQLEKGSQATSYVPYMSRIELCKLGNYQDRIYKNGNKWYLEKKIGKVVLNGSETYSGGSVGTNIYRFYKSIDGIMAYTDSSRHIDRFITDRFKLSTNNEYGASYQYQSNLYFCVSSSEATTYNEFKTWLQTHNTSVYYVLATPTTTEITDTELISQLNSIELLEGLNNVSVVSPCLQGIINIHYNYVNETTTSDLLFCGVVKNSGNISLNPRYPHYQTLQILDFKTFLSEGETLDFVIANKTIEEAIDQVVDTISPYGFIKGNIEILGAETIIGAYSTKDKTAYDVFNYLADITQSRWTTRLIDENTVAIDFYDPTLLPRGETIQYNETWFKNNLIDDISYSYGSNDYRNKQVMTSKEVIGELEQVQIVYANGYQTQFMTEIKIAQINEIDVNGEPKTYATEDDKELGVEADFYYSIGNNIIESADTYSTGAVIIIRYLPIVEGRQIITNNDEIDRVSTATGRKGVVARYEDRNDAITSNELQLIGQSYIRYKGVPEIKLNVQTRSNLWNIGDRVQFNAPITELATEYMVKKKTINRILANPDSEEHIVYTFELTSSFNSEQAINYFDNQRAKSKGNIGEGEAISRNIDIENETNIIFYDSNIVEITVVGDNVLNSTLNSPLNN